MARLEAFSNPDLLRWARLSSGFALDVAAKKIGSQSAQLESWETGTRRPTFNQLRKMASVYKRPVAVFFLAEPPTDFQVLRDFRKLPGAAPLAESPELLYEMRRAQERRELALELYETAEDEAPPVLQAAASLTEDPEHVGEIIRRQLHVTQEEQVSWPAGYESFNGWRRALERAGVLVFQATEVSLDEMRGFSVYGEALPAIVLNIKDSIRGRTFTLLHEFAHLLLHQAGICLPTESSSLPDDEAQRIEVFCNRAAGAALVPASTLLAETSVARHIGNQWSDEELSSLANRFGVSREVVLRRLLTLGKTSDVFYQDKRQAFEDEYASESRPQGGFAPPHRMVISASGPLFVRLVLTNYHRDSITASDVADLLSVRLKHLPRIEAEVPASG